jgi:hypothetical protein
MKILLYPLYALLAEIGVISLIGFVLTGFKIRPLFFWFYAIVSWILTVIAYILAPLVVRLVDTNGNLPYLLRWMQTTDAPCWGADFWATDNPTYSKYKLIVTWLWRNPAQGFDKFCKADVAYNTMVDVRGNIGIRDTSPHIGGWFLITCCGYFQLSIIWPTKYVTFVSHTGWNLEPIAKGYTHQTLGALKATPLRFYIGNR